MMLPAPYFQDDAVTIYLGDCRDILPLLPPVDLVLTDPPYGIGKAIWDSQFPDWMFPLLVAKAKVYGIMPGTGNLLHLPPSIGTAIYRWTLAVRIINGVTHGAFGFQNWIPCVVWCDPLVKLGANVQDCTEIAIRGEMPDHPSPKPLDAIRWLIERLPGNTILDPFMGSGTTLRAAKDFGRKAIGIEIEERYCEIAAERMSQAVLL